MYLKFTSRQAQGNCTFSTLCTSFSKTIHLNTHNSSYIEFYPVVGNNLNLTKYPKYRKNLNIGKMSNVTELKFSGHYFMLL